MSKIPFFIVSILVIFGILAAIVIFDGKTSAPGSKNSAATVQSQIPATTDSLGTYTSADVAKHSSATDCWTIVNGAVYDITSYVPRHPGGQEILQACGTDGTSLFTQRKTTSGESVGSGTPHSSTAKNQLSALKIGILTQ